MEHARSSDRCGTRAISRASWSTSTAKKTSTRLNTKERKFKRRGGRPKLNTGRLVVRALRSELGHSSVCGLFCLFYVVHDTAEPLRHSTSGDAAGTQKATRSASGPYHTRPPLAWLIVPLLISCKNTRKCRAEFAHPRTKKAVHLFARPGPSDEHVAALSSLFGRSVELAENWTLRAGSLF